MPHFDI